MSVYKPKARRDAFLILYQWDMKGEDINQLTEEYMQANRIDYSEHRRYVRKLVKTFFENRVEIDKLIGELSEKWDIDRISYIDRNILRVALAEILYIKPKNPKLLVYDYVKLSQKYAGKNSVKFVNGLLGRVVREKLGAKD